LNEQLKECLKWNIQAARQPAHKKVFCHPLNNESEALASSFQYRNTDRESARTKHMRNKFSNINSTMFSQAGLDMGIVDEICFWFMV